MPFFSQRHMPRHSVSTHAGRATLGATLCGLALLGTGCVGDKGTAPLQSPAGTLGTIQTTPLNAIMAVGETLQIGVTGKTLTGAPVTSFDSVLYLLVNENDTARVQVSPTGLLTARASSGATPIMLDAVAFKDGVARASEVVIQITPTAIAGVTLSIQPQAGDSARLAPNSSKTIVPLVWNPTTGERVNGPTFRYTYHNEDAWKMVCNAPSFVPVGDLTNLQLAGTFCLYSVGLNRISVMARADSVWVIASATVYGVALRDSVKYILTNPYSDYVYMLSSNLAAAGGSSLVGTVYLAPGGIITFYNLLDPSLGSTVDFVLDNPAAATADTPPATVGDSIGNVIGLNGGESSNRRFNTSGTYHYTATVRGSVPPFTGAQATGVIVVQ